MDRIECYNNLPTISIIVLNYNCYSHLRSCLESLIYLNYPKNNYEVILADNNSTDGSIEFIKTYFPWVRVLNFDKNYGYAEGNNLAAKQVSSKYVAFVNPDTYLDKNWLIEVVIAAIKYENNSVVAIGGKIKFLENSAYVQVAGSKMCVHGNGMNIGYGDIDNPIYDEVRYTLSPAGCAMLVNRTIFLKLGGFDKDYFMYVEEFDFGYRLWLAGYKSLYVPSAVAHHKMGDNFRFKVKPFMLFHEEKNKLSTIVKNFETITIFKGVFIYICFFMVKVILYLYRREFHFIIPMINGVISFSYELPRVLKKRGLIQSSRKRSDKDMYENDLIAPVNECVREFIRINSFR